MGLFKLVAIKAAHSVLRDGAAWMWLFRNIRDPLQNSLNALAGPCEYSSHALRVTYL